MTSFIRHHLPSNIPVGEYTLARPRAKNPEMAMMVQSGRVLENVSLPSDHAIQKIAALEDELMQLRAQIASIVAMQETKTIQSC